MKHGKHLLLCTLLVVWGWQTGLAQCTYSLSEVTTSVACAADNNGAINLTVTGNTSPYTYLWSNSGDTEDLNGLTAGTYTVTVTDALGCTATLSATVAAGAPSPVANAGPDQELTCVINAVTLFGTGSSSGSLFEYNWSGPGIFVNNQNQVSPVVNLAGQYTLVVTNTATGCSASDVVLVLQDAVLPLAAAGPDVILTCVNSQAVLDGNASSAGPNFTYSWSAFNGGSIVTGASSRTPTVNAAGTYELVVVNTANGCTDSDVVEVNSDFDLPVISLEPFFGFPCFGTSVTLSLTVTPNAVYNWTGPNNFTSNFQNPVVSIPGTYTVIATNFTNGCTASAQTKVLPAPVIPAQQFLVTNVPCLPGQFGAIDMTVNFGTGPYAYSWSNGANSEDLANLSVGTYTVQVVDGTGCTYMAEVKVAQGVSSMVINFSNQNLVCFGGNTGGVTTMVTNGSAPYTFQWEGPSGFTSTQQNLSGLSVGVYSLTVTDATGCTKTQTTTITSSPALSIPAGGTTITFPDCFNSNGGINISPTGGTPPYTYDWSNDGPETPDNDPQDITGLVPGSYRVTLTDNNGCTLVSPFYSIPVSSTLQLSATTTPVPCGSGANTGAINLSVSGGIPPYTYVWTTSQTTQDINNLPAGNYTVTVTQANGCTKELTVTVQNGSAIPLSDFTVLEASCAFNSSDGAITLNNLPATGTAPFTFNWTGPNGFSLPFQNLTNLIGGFYSLEITDANNCLFTASVLVDNTEGDMQINLTQGSVNCNFGIIQTSVTNGAAPFTYQWSDGSTTANLNYTQLGIYTITVTDAFGCTNTASIDVTVPVGLMVTSNITAVTCLGGGADGAIALDIQNGSGQYSINWNGVPGGTSISNLAPGTYCAVITDLVNGCSATRCEVLAMPSQMAVIMPNTNGPTCWGSSDGSTQISITNAGTAPYSWELAGATSQSGTSATSSFLINGLQSGTYCITVTNSGGCSAQVCSPFSSPPPLTVPIETLSNTCNAAVLQANASGGVVPYTFSWGSTVNVTGTTQVINTTLSGVYMVTVVDANGCSTVETINLDLAGNGTCGFLRGTVAQDLNENCSVEAAEPGLAGWLVRALGADTLYGITDADGRYLVGVPVGTYTMEVLPPNNLWILCPDPAPVTLVNANDTLDAGDFPVQKLVLCPALTVSISTSLLRRCFNNNYYHVSYCNEGTAPALGAYVDVELDAFLTFVSATAPFQDLGNNIYRFFIGNLAIGQCGNFKIRILVNCASTLGQTHCTRAHIYPDDLCNTNQQWSGASLDLRGVCETDSMRFIIKNVGNGNMTSAVDYIVVEDAVMIMQSMVPLLESGDSVSVAYPANGSTWFVQVGQEALHPFPDPRSLSVEGCTTNASFSMGFVNQFPQSSPEPFVDEDCTENIGSFDPNDKRGFPDGYGAEHYVWPGTELDYLIRFQNTGTDTAFNIVILDTLSKWFDPASIKFGASSHPYRYDLTGEGVAHFIFENILLPDSNINEPASNGFVRFSIKPRSDMPLETLVENTAAIYFDFNEPIFTNTTFHRFGENFIQVGLWQPELPQASISVVPNPFATETLLSVEGLDDLRGLRLQVFDLFGKELQSIEADGSSFRLKRGNWPGGMYLFRITRNGKLVGSGKLHVE